MKTYLLPEKLNHRVHILKWAFPIGIAILVLVYQFVFVNSIQAWFGDRYQFIAEVLFYGTLGPILAFLFLDTFERWLEERETADLQARVLAEVRQDADQGRKLGDDSLQALFAVSVLLKSIKQRIPDLESDEEAIIEDTEQTIERAMIQLRDHLETPPEEKAVNDQPVLVR